MMDGRRIRTTSAPGRAEPQRLGVAVVNQQQKQKQQQAAVPAPTLALMKKIASSRPGDGNGIKHETFTLSASKAAKGKKKQHQQNSNTKSAAASPDVAAPREEEAAVSPADDMGTARSPPPEDQDFILAAMEESQKRTDDDDEGDDHVVGEEDQDAAGDNATPKRATIQGEEDDSKNEEEQESSNRNLFPLPKDGIYEDTQLFKDIRYRLAEEACGEFLLPQVVTLANDIIEQHGDRCTWAQSKGFKLPDSSALTSSTSGGSSFATPLRSTGSAAGFADGTKDSLFGSKMKAGALQRGGQHPQIGGGGGGGIGGQPRKKYFANIELHHRVQGVLNKVTPYDEKYREVRNELLTLPISGADSESLGKVVNVFFMKAVKEPHFSSLYARLVGEICKVPKNEQLGDIKESAAYKLRRELLTKCQREFEKPLHPPTSELVEIHPAEQSEFLVQRRKDQMANIKFVGELFNLKLITPPIIHRVIMQLLFGISPTAALPMPPGVPGTPEYYASLPKYDADDLELDLLKALLTTAGASFMQQQFGQMQLPEVIRRVEEFSQSHPVTRVRFIMMDLVDLAHKGFVPKTKTFKTAEDIEQEQLDAKADIEEQLARKHASGSGSGYPGGGSSSRAGPVLGGKVAPVLGGGGGSPAPLGSGPPSAVKKQRSSSLHPPGYGGSPVPVGGGGCKTSSSPPPAWSRGNGTGTGAVVAPPGSSQTTTPARGTAGQQRGGNSPPPPPYAGGGGAAGSPVPGRSPTAQNAPLPPPPPPPPFESIIGQPATSASLPESTHTTIAPELPTPEVVPPSAPPVAAAADASLPPLPALTVEAIGHLMHDLKKTKEHSRIAKTLLRYSVDERMEAMTIWIRRALRTTRCVEDRNHLPHLLNALVKESLAVEIEEVAVAADKAKTAAETEAAAKPSVAAEPEQPKKKSYAAASGSASAAALVPAAAASTTPTLESIVEKYQDVVLLVVQKDIIKARAWDDVPRIWKYWAQTIGAGSLQGKDSAGGGGKMSEEELMGEGPTAAAAAASRNLLALASGDRPVLSAKNAKTNPQLHRDTKVLNQGLHNQVLRRLLDALKTGHVKAPDVRLFITSVLSYNNDTSATVSSATALASAAAAPAAPGKKATTTPVTPWYYLDPEADFARFRPLAVCAKAEDDSNEKRRLLVDSFFSDEKMKKEDIEHMVYWWCRKDRLSPEDVGGVARMNAIFETLRKHPHTQASATMVAKIVGAVRASNSICGEDFFDAFKRLLHLTVDGADRALRELYVLVEAYQTGSILDTLLPAASGFGNTKFLRKQGIVSEETMMRGKKLFGTRPDAQSLAGLGTTK